VANTTAYELLAWAGLALVVARIGRTGDCRWWLAGGLVAGLGVADDDSMSFFAIALVIGALLSGGRRMIGNRWFLAGAAIAVAFEVPDLWWQAQHGWATIAMTRALNRENGGLADIGTWVVGQLGMVTLALAWVWVAGLRFLWRSGRPLWRAMAWACGLLFVLFAVTAGAQTYYLGAAYVYLLAGGTIAIDAWLQARPGRLRNLLIASALTTAVAVPIVLPVLPAADIAWTYKTNPTLGETVGWPQFVQTVDGVWKSLPPSQRASAVIFTADYGEAAAINELGRGTGLPTAVRGDNTEWWWGPVTRTPPPSWPSRRGPSTTARATAITSRSFSPSSGWRPRCRIRTASTTRNGAATSISAPALASRGPRYGPNCATTADNRAPQSPNPRLRRAGRAAVVRRPGLRTGPSPSQHDRAHPDTTHVRPGQLPRNRSQSRTFCTQRTAHQARSPLTPTRRSDFPLERWRIPYGDRRPGRDSVSEYSSSRMYIRPGWAASPALAAKLMR
jgi:hypothetical protein